MTLFQARKIVHAPEAFSRSMVKTAVAFILGCAQADDEDRFWADAAE
jgi:hypothetical protein